VLERAMDRDRLGLRQPYLVSTWRSVSATVIVTSGELP
jgi:hypothetical protein